jgi:hypothetical protein
MPIFQIAEEILDSIADFADYPTPTTTTREDEERARQRELEERLRQELAIELDELRDMKGNDGA